MNPYKDNCSMVGAKVKLKDGRDATIIQESKDSLVVNTLEGKFTTQWGQLDTMVQPPHYWRGCNGMTA